jgi:N-hydroxyarylamine O-acetyltransferase
VNTRAYLERIDYRGSTAPTAETLRQMHRAHLLAIPFENLSIHSGERIVLENESLFDKVVTRRRGGFCYELNGLFAALLRALSFNVAMVSARVRNAAGEFGPEFDHMALIVLLDERWLADVGFGDSFREPLLLDKDAEQVQDSHAYRIDSQKNLFTLLRRGGPDEWIAQYRFTLKPREYADYAAMCHYHQTSPDSHFTQRRICTRATSDGRITLQPRRQITTTSAGRQEREFLNDAEYAEALREHFGIELGN